MESVAVKYYVFGFTGDETAVLADSKEAAINIYVEKFLELWEDESEVREWLEYHYRGTFDPLRPVMKSYAFYGVDCD